MCIIFGVQIGLIFGSGGNSHIFFSNLSLSSGTYEKEFSKDNCTKFHSHRGIRFYLWFLGMYMYGKCFYY